MIVASHLCNLPDAVPPIVRPVNRFRTGDIQRPNLIRLPERNCFRQLKFSTEDLSGSIETHCMLIPYSSEPVDTMSSPV